MALLLGGIWLASPSERSYIDIASGRERTDKIFMFLTTHSTIHETDLSRWSQRSGDPVWRHHETWNMVPTAHMPWRLAQNYSHNFMINLDFLRVPEEQRRLVAIYFLNQFARIDAGLLRIDAQHSHQVRDVQLAIEDLQPPRSSDQVDALLSTLPDWDIDAPQDAP
ncbi:MAG: hypothetical protein RIB32_01340 [Phycisphaerales bacterium]